MSENDFGVIQKGYLLPLGAFPPACGNQNSSSFFSNAISPETLYFAQNRHNAKRTSPSFSDNSSSLLNFFSGSSPAVPSCKFTTEVSRSLKTSSSSVENSPAAAAFFAIFWPRMRAGKLSGTRAISSFKEVCLCPSS